MLQLGSKTFTVDGVTVFADHADPDQFWCLPAPVQIARRGPDKKAQFTLIKFKPAAVNAGVRGGGFLMIETELTLDKATEKKILAKCAPLSNGSPRLTAVPFDDGDVQCIALNLQGAGGTTATATPGGITFVEKILGASKPSLAGNNTAAFSLTLDQEGAILLEQAFKEGGGPVGVIYQLKYTALRPALDVEITADYKRAYHSLKLGVDFSAGFLAGAVPIYLKAGLDAAFEKLKEDGVIQIKVINFSTDKDAADKEKWALDFFKENLMAEWFKPTLPPVQFPSDSSDGINIPGVGKLPVNIPGVGGGTTPGGGEAPAGGAAKPTTPAGGAAKPTTPAGGAASASSAAGGAASAPSPAGGTAGTAHAAGGAAGSAASASGAAAGGPSAADAGTTKTTASVGSPPAAGSSGGAAAGSSHPEAGAAGAEAPSGAPSGAPAGAGLPPAVLTITKRDPASAASEYNIVLTTPSPGPAPKETLTFQGGGQPPVVQINGTERQLDDQRQLKLDVPPGETLNISAVYPGSPATAELFFLYFDHEKPEPAGFSAVPPSPVYKSYLNNAPNPPDARFTESDGSIDIDGSSTEGGAAALHEWLQTRLATPKQVTVDSHASYENDDHKAALNLQLTQRRRQVAVGIIGSLAQVTGGTFHGFQEARAAHRVSDPNDRVAVIRGKGLAESSVTLTATLSRAAAPGGTGPQPGPTPPGDKPSDKPPATKPPDTKPADTKPADTKPADTKPAAASPPGMGVSLAFKLQIVDQEELKTVKLRYNRTDAVQQNYNPQGFIGLLTQDMGPGHFIEVDLDDPFFRTLDIVVDAPIDFDKIGLVSAQMALDYGNPTDPVGVKHTDFTFEKTSPKERQHSFFMNPNRDTSFKVAVQYNFDPLSGWEGEKFSYDIPPKVTEDRTLLLNPFENFGFLELKILAGDMDWSAVKSTDVHLRYEDPGIFTKQTIITLRPDSGEQVWKLRLTNPDKRDVSYFFVHHLMDGSTRQTAEATTSATSIAVDDSFEDSLDIEFIPTYDTANIRSVFVDFHYEDPAHKYVRDEHLEFSGDTPERQRLHIALFDPNVKEYQLIYTLLGKDNSVRRLPAVTGSARLVFVGETFK